MNYTKEQKRAIHHGSGNLQLIACAGSGKTQVLAERIVRLLKSGEAKPENIIAFTFTKKAAGELKDRVYQLARKRIGHDTGLADMYVGTIHAFCLEFIQEYVQEYLKCSVLSEVQQRLFIDRNSRKCGMSDLKTLKDGKPLQRFKGLSKSLGYRPPE